MARLLGLDLRSLPSDADRNEVMQAFRTRVRRELGQRYPAAVGYALSPPSGDACPGPELFLTRGESWGLILSIRPDDPSCRRVTVAIGARSRGMEKVRRWIFRLAAALGILVGAASFALGVVQEGKPRQSLAPAFVLGVAAALAAVAAGLLLVLPLRKIQAAARRSDIDDVEKILDRVWQGVRLECAGLPPLARRVPVLVKWLLAAVGSGGAAVGLWFGGRAAASQGLSVLLVVLACVGAVVAFGSVVGTLYHALVPNADLHRGALDDVRRFEETQADVENRPPGQSFPGSR
jgi:hypothetical protein